MDNHCASTICQIKVTHTLLTQRYRDLEDIFKNLLTRRDPVLADSNETTIELQATLEALDQALLDTRLATYALKKIIDKFNNIVINGTESEGEG